MSTAYYERICQEDIETGTSTTTKRNPGGGTLVGTQVGIHTLATGQASATATWSPGAIAAGSYASTTITVTGAVIGDFVLASHDKILTSAIGISAHVSAANTVTVVLLNLTGGSITPASGTLKVLVLPSR